MPFYDAIDLNQRERVALAPGSYGTSTAPGLKILAYIDKASKLDKSGAMRNSFLVGAIRPNREQLQAVATHNGNGKSAAAGETPFSEPEFDGTAFLSLTIHEDWKHPAALALAFTEASRNKDGKVMKDHVAAGVAAGEFTQELADQGKDYYMATALRKVQDANTPADQVEAATAAQYRKELTQISIKVGQLFTLQDWAGLSRDPAMEVVTLVGCEFSGKVETSSFGDKTGSEVSAIYSKSKK